MTLVKPKTRKKRLISENYVKTYGVLFQRVLDSGLSDQTITQNFGSHEEGFSKEIIPNQNTIYQSLLHLSTKNNFVM